MATAAQTKPYSGPKDPKLPDHVKKMSEPQRATWVRTFNGVMDENDDEGQAMRLANAAAKRTGKKDLLPEDLSAEDMAVLADVAFSVVDHLRDEADGAKALPTPVMVAMAKAHGHDLGAKCDECMAAMPEPYGGATSFSELDAWSESMKVQAHISEASWQFQALQQNIFNDEDMDAEEKATALSALAREFQSRVRRMPEEEKALLDGAKAGRRMNKQQLGMFKNAIDTLKGLVGWANYDEDDDEKKKTLAAGAAEALVTSFKLYTEPDGTYRWVTYSSNAFEDLEKELFSTKALEDAVNYADLSGERGPLRVFHIPGADVGPCDFQAIAGRMLIESGTFYGNPTGQAAAKFFKDAADNGEQFGVSIGYLFEKGDERDGVYDWLRIKERSVTPAGRAANPFTSFSLGGIPVLQITDEKKSFLERVVGKDNAAGIISQAERATKALQDAGVRFKENGEPELTPPAPAAGADTGTTAAAAVPAAAAATNPEPEGDAEAAKQIITMIGETTKGLEALALAVKAIADRLDTLEKSDDEKISAQLGPRRVAPNSVQRPSEKAGNDISGKGEAVAAILERNRASGGDKEGSVDGEGEGLAPNPVGPYIQDLYRTLNIETAPAGAAAS